MLADDNPAKTRPEHKIRGDSFEIMNEALSAKDVQFSIAEPSGG